MRLRNNFPVMQDNRPEPMISFSVAQARLIERSFHVWHKTKLIRRSQIALPFQEQSNTQNIEFSCPAASAQRYIELPDGIH